MRKHTFTLLILLNLLLRGGVQDGGAATLNVTNADSLRSAMQSAEAGDEIVLAPGVYPGRFAALGMSGVTIRSADPNNRAVIDGAGFGEGLKLSNVSDVTLSDLIIQGAELNAINIDDNGAPAALTKREYGEPLDSECEGSRNQACRR